MKTNFLAEIKKNRVLLLMLAPATIYFFIFHYVPMGGIILAFKQFRYDLGIFGSPWVGFENFRFFFISGQAFVVTRNTILYNTAFIIINTTMEIFVAIVLTELTGKFFKKLFQSFMFLPYFISWVVVSSFVFNLFNYEYGSLNTILRSINAEPVDIYSNPNYWIPIIIAFCAWKWIGYGSVIYLAAIAGIDMEIYEAARIDGANVFHQIRHITIPSLIPTIIILVLLEISHIFRGDFSMFYQLVGNNGTLFNTTDVIDTFVFRSLLRTSEFGMAAASGLYQSVLCFVIIVSINKLIKTYQKDYALF